MTTTDKNAETPTLDDAEIERLLAVCETLPAALKALREARALLAEARDALARDPDCDSSDLLGKLNAFLGSRG